MMASGLHLFYRWQVYDVRLGVSRRSRSIKGAGWKLPPSGDVFEGVILLKHPLLCSLDLDGRHISFPPPR